MVQIWAVVLMFVGVIFVHKQSIDVFVVGLMRVGGNIVQFIATSQFYILQFILAGM